MKKLKNKISRKIINFIFLIEFIFFSFCLIIYQIISDFINMSYYGNIWGFVAATFSVLVMLTSFYYLPTLIIPKIKQEIRQFKLTKRFFGYFGYFLLILAAYTIASYLTFHLYIRFFIIPERIEILFNSLFIFKIIEFCGYYLTLIFFFVGSITLLIILHEGNQQDDKSID